MPRPETPGFPSKIRLPSNTNTIPITYAQEITGLSRILKAIPLQYIEMAIFFYFVFHAPQLSLNSKNLTLSLTMHRTHVKVYIEIKKKKKRTFIIITNVQKAPIHVRVVLTKQPFSRFSSFFSQTKQMEKQETFPQFQNLTEGKIFGKCFAFQYLEKKIGKHGNTKNCAKKKWRLDKKSSIRTALIRDS